MATMLFITSITCIILSLVIFSQRQAQKNDKELILAGKNYIKALETHVETLEKIDRINESLIAIYRTDWHREKDAYLYQ